MKRNLLFGLLLLSFAMLTIFGCGGGGGGGGGPETTISGTVAKGPVKGSTIKVFEIISSHNPNKARVGAAVIGQGTTLDDGSYRVNIGLTRGAILVEATGGTYTDEATGTANTALSTPIRAAFGNISGMVRRGDSITVQVTPFTELGFRALGADRPSDGNIVAANARVSSTLDLAGLDVVRTRPIPANVAPPAGATEAQITYGLILAIVSQLTADGLTLEEVLDQLAPDIQAGVLSQANSDAGEVALLNFLNGPFNQFGPADAITVTVAASKSLVTNDDTDKSVISATVTNGEGNVPDGTRVSFVIKSGAGANLSAASATTVGGVASVDLKGTVDGAEVVVTASAGGVSSDSPTVTFLNPNRPAAVALTASPATGVTTALAAVPVTLTATVSPVSPQGAIANGTPVTFTIVSGTGTLSAASANTTNGVASVTLNSAQANTVRVTASVGTVTSPPRDVPFVSQPTQAIVTVALAGTLPAGRVIGATSANIAFNPNKGLGQPTSTRIGIGVDADLFAANTGLNPTRTGAAWQAGTQPGTLQTLTFPIAAGNFPVAADFTAHSSSTIVDLNNVSLAGAISVQITNVEIR